METQEFRGFAALADNLIKPEGGIKETLENDDIPFTDPEEIQDKEDEELEEEESKEEDTGKDTEDEELEEEIDKEEKEDASGDTEEIDPKFESDITKFFQQKLAEELGWEYDEKEAFESVSDLVEYMETLVETASKPKYSNEEIGKIDEFVKNGGRLEDYYKSISTGNVNVDLVDITKESNQRLVVEEHLRTLGYNEERIKKAVDRYEDRGTLEDEAEDALELLKEYKEKNKEKLLDTQQKEVLHAREEQQKFIANVEGTIDKLTDIAGYPLTPREKKELKEYIFKPNKDGRTQYQVEYSSDQERNLIESAFFTKNKDVILEKAKKQASTDTLKNMQQKLKAQSKRTKNVSSQRETGSEALLKLGQLISKN